MFDFTGDMTQRVLLVDEDARFLSECKQNLKDKFHVVTALGSDQGMRALADEGPFAVVVSELNIYGANGIQFLSRTQRSSPHSAGVLLLGSDDLETAIKAITKGDIFRFLMKPFSPLILEKTLQAGIEQYAKDFETEKAAKREKTPGSKKRILIVDDNPVVRSIATSTLRNYKDFAILTAENGRVAKTLLNIIKIDMVVTDLEMPVMSGLQLLFYLKSHYPDTPVIVLTWFLKKEIEKSMMNMGYKQYLEKPLKIDDLIGLIVETLNEKSVAQVQGISTSAFLQLIEADEITCTLIVQHGNEVGRLYFLKGSLIDAETEHFKGEQAAYKIIGWENSRIELENHCPKREKVINKSLMMVLLEANRILDEKAGSMTIENNTEIESSTNIRVLQNPDNPVQIVQD